MTDLTTVVAQGSVSSVLAGLGKGELETNAFPAFAGTQRWFAGKDSKIVRAEIVRHAELEGGEDGLLLTELELETDAGTRHRYLLPLEIVWGEEHICPGAPYAPYTMARVRRSARMGALVDSTVLPDVTRVMLASMRKAAPLKGEGLLFRKSPKLDAVDTPEDIVIKRMGAEQSNTSVLVGRKLIMKYYRRLEAGMHPEIEITRHLTDVAGFENTPALYGSAEWVDADGNSTAFAAAYAFVENQGDAWEYSLDVVQRAVENQVLKSGHKPELPDNAFSAEIKSVAKLGLRSRDMHDGLAKDGGNPDFTPVAVNQADIDVWVKNAQAQLDKAAKAIKTAKGDLAEKAAAAIDKLRENLDPGIQSFAGLTKTRVHGDYHLGQVLVVPDDFYLVDFEGEPQRSMEERRMKTSPLKDVAGMLRSFDYVAWTAADRLSSTVGADAAGVHAALAVWRDKACDAFLEGYGGEAGLSDDQKRLMDLFLIEKAAYELCYEVQNRPTFLHVPLNGLIALAARQ